MHLRNWEFYEDGQPLVGATVLARASALTHPNLGTVLASTQTDSNGMWEFGALTDTAKDIEIIWGNSGQYHRWYKGMSRHGIEFMFEAQTPVYVRAQRQTSDQPIAASTTTVIIHNGEIQDDTNSYNPVTGVFTAPRAGRYLVTGNMTINPSVTSLTFASLRVNGGPVRELFRDPALPVGLNSRAYAYPANLAAGATMDITAFCVNAAILDGVNILSKLEIVELGV